MTIRSLQLLERAAELRWNFDQGFAEPPRGERSSAEDLLVIRIAEDTYCLQLAQIAGLLVDRRIAPLPSPVPALLGVIAARGVIVPVYSLRVLLAYPPADAPRWLVIVRGAEPIGLAFDRFESHVRSESNRISDPEGGVSSRPCLRSAVVLADRTIPLIDLQSAVERINHWARESNSRGSANS
jgi:chemotaxis signal transduction protein